jgi:hypothetical protein
MSTALPTPSELWQLLLAFFSFDLFITPSVLIFMYWLGAVGIPLLAIVVIRKILHQPPIPDISEVPVWRRNRTLVIASGITMFVFAELMWRMMVETVLAYFQMRDALIGASSL